MPLHSIPLVDWLVILVYLAASMAIGIAVTGRSKSAEGFLVGGRQLSWWMLLVSIVATETSTVTFLSLPGKSYDSGGNLTFLQLVFGYCLGRLLVVLWLLPTFFSGRFLTAYEVLEESFGPAVRTVVSLLFLVMRTLADGLRLLLTGLLVSQATGIDFIVCVAILTAATALYATVGGVASVVFNDCLQFATYMIGAACVLSILLWESPEGPAGVWDFAESTGRLELFNWSLSLTTPSITFLSGLIGGAALTMATHGADNMMVKRYLCARSQRQAGWALALSGPLVAAQFLLFLAVGIALAHSHNLAAPDYGAEGGDEALIGFIVHRLGQGLRGLVIASVLAASMSTLSSSVNASAGVLVNDVRRRWIARGDDQRTVFAARVATLLFALLQAAVAIAAHQGGLDRSVIDAVLGIAGFTTGLVLGIYGLAAILGRASEASGLIGIAAGFLCCCWVAFELKVSWPWFSLVGSTVTIMVGGVASSFIPPRSKEA